MELKYQWEVEPGRVLTVDMRNVYGKHMYFLCNATLDELLQFFITYPTRESRREWVHRLLREEYTIPVPARSSSSNAVISSSDADHSHSGSTPSGASSSCAGTSCDGTHSSSTASGGSDTVQPAVARGGSDTVQPAAASGGSAGTSPSQCSEHTSAVSAQQLEKTWIVQKKYYQMYTGFNSIPRNLANLKYEEEEKIPWDANAQQILEDDESECDSSDFVEQNQWDIVEELTHRTVTASARVAMLQGIKNSIEQAKRGEYVMQLDDIEDEDDEHTEQLVIENLAECERSNAQRWGYIPTVNQTASTDTTANVTRQSTRIIEQQQRTEAWEMEESDEQADDSDKDANYSGNSSSESEDEDDMNVNSQELEKLQTIAHKRKSTMQLPTCKRRAAPTINTMANTVNVSAPVTIISATSATTNTTASVPALTTQTLTAAPTITTIAELAYSSTTVTASVPTTTSTGLPMGVSTNAAANRVTRSSNNARPVQTPNKSINNNVVTSLSALNCTVNHATAKKQANVKTGAMTNRSARRHN